MSRRLPSSASVCLCDGMKAAAELLGSEPFLLAFLLLPDLGIQLGNSGIQTSLCRPQGSHRRAKPSPWETPPSPAHYTHSGFQRSHEDLQHAGNTAVGQTNAVSQKNLANPVSHGAACHENILPLCSESAASSQEHKQCWGKIPGTAWLVMRVCPGQENRLKYCKLQSYYRRQLGCCTSKDW